MLKRLSNYENWGSIGFTLVWGLIALAVFSFMASVISVPGLVLNLLVFLGMMLFSMGASMLMIIMLINLVNQFVFATMLENQLGTLETEE